MLLLPGFDFVTGYWLLVWFFDSIIVRGSAYLLITYLLTYLRAS